VSTVDERVNAVVRVAVELASDDPHGDFEVAREVLVDTPQEVVARLAVMMLVDLIREHLRASTRRIEREASDDETEVKFERPRYGSRAYGEWVQTTEEGRAYNDEKNACREKYDNLLLSHIAAFTKQYAAELRIEWTAELLASPFALPDGTRVTWGEASLAQHQERVEMFEANVAANVEGAARHRRAIDALQEARAGCLNDLAQVPS
jgi:hypothetical protein